MLSDFLSVKAIDVTYFLRRKKYPGEFVFLLPDNDSRQ